MEDGLAIEFGWSEVWGVSFEKFAEQKSLTGERLGSRVVGKEVEEFVAEDGDAAGFEADDGRTGGDLRGEFVENFQEKRLGAVEHAVVVERAAAAEVGRGEGDAEAGGFQDFDGGDGGFGVEIVIESVGPEEDGASFRG